MNKKKTKPIYCLRNWREYNTALVERGSLTIWVSEDVMEAWQNQERSGQRGRPRIHTDTAILGMATLELLCGDPDASGTRRYPPSERGAYLTAR